MRAPEEALLDPYLLAEGCVAVVDDLAVGRIHEVGIVHRLSASPGRVRGRSPLPGEHNDEILSALGSETAPPAPRRRPTSAASGDRPPAALAGVRVLDLGLAMAGPYGAQVLGDLGADVIKVHNPGERRSPISSPNLGCNRGKRSIAIDLKDPRGRAILHRLVAGADVVHHNMRTGVAERLGADYETLRRVNPRLIYCHTRGFERSGPRVGLPGNDQMGQALAGTWYEMGSCHQGRPPAWHPTAMGDFGNGILSAAAVIQALYHRETTGEGQAVDTSIINVGMLFNSYTYSRDDGGQPERVRLDGDQLGLGALYRLYQCADGWLCLAVSDDCQWRALVDATAVASLAHPDFATAAGRARHDRDITATIEAVMASRTAMEWFETLDAFGVPCEISSDTFPRRLFDDPGLVREEWVVSRPHPRLGLVEQAGHLVVLSDTPGRIGPAAPLVGEHSRAILRELGESDRLIDDLLAAGVIAEP